MILEVNKRQLATLDNNRNCIEYNIHIKGHMALYNPLMMPLDNILNERNGHCVLTITFDFGRNDNMESTVMFDLQLRDNLLMKMWKFLSMYDLQLKDQFIDPV